MKIDRLRLRAFRGVRGELSLDLTSPLTLLYAANGTGKTSICDAVEWLLTGRVGRMGHKLRTAGQDLRCRFSQSQTYVEAEIRKNGKTKRLRRELREQGPRLLHYRPAVEKWRNYSNADALRWCAPLAPRHARAGRIPAEDTRRWLRATHFLEGPSLGFLIDASEEAEETRRLLFAQLLGVGELEKRDQLFARLLDILRPERGRLERELEELEAARRRRRQEAAAASYPPAELEQRARQAVATTRRVLERNIADPPAEIALLRVALQGESDGLEKQRHALRHLQANLSNWHSLDIRIAQDRQQIADLEARRGGERRRLDELEAAVGTAGAGYRRQHSRSAAIEALAVEAGQLRHQLDRWLAEWAPASSPASSPADSSGEVRLAAAQAEVERLERELEEARDHCRRLRRCREQLPEWQRAYAEAGRRRRLRGLAELRDQALEEQDELSTALDRLRLLLGATDDASHATRGTTRGATRGAAAPARCPPCGHDHGAPRDLRRAIRTAVEAAPESPRIRSPKVEAIQQDTAARDQLLAEQDQPRQRLESTDQQHAETTAVLANAVKHLEDALDVAFSEADLDGPGLASRLESLHAEAEASLDRLGQDAESARQRCLAGRKLHDTGRSMAEVGERLARLVPADPAPAPRPSPAAWHERMTEIESVIEQARRDETECLAAAAAEKQRLGQERDAVNGRIEEIDRRLGVSRKKLAEALEELASLEQSWRILGAPEPSPGAAGLERAEQDLDRRGDELGRAGDALAEASRFRGEARKAEEALRAAEDLDTRLAGQRRAGDKLRAWVADLEVAREALEAERKRYVRRQIEPLSGVISAVYRRAQGNEVVDRIEPPRQGAEVDKLLGWRPRVGGEELSISQLSLGQRQDLALAIFLARARSLGGSFFLDEPLIHLDDLNRVALLDTLRVLALYTSSANRPRLVITTAGSALMRHFREKLSLVPWQHGVPPLRIYRLEGDPRQGVEIQEICVPEDRSYAT